MSRLFDTYGIGNAIVDLQVRVGEEDLRKLGIEKASFRLVDEKEYGKLTRYLSKHEMHRSSGGSAANSIIAITQLGGKTAYAGVVADDELGEFYRSEMEEIGVDFHNAPRTDLKSGTSLILITPDAERTMNTFLGATATFGPDDVRADLLAQSEWLFVEGYLFSTETGREAVKKAIDIAKQNNVKIAVTFADTFIVETFRDALREAVKDSDLVFANVNEARRFTGEHDEEPVFSTLKLACPNCVMTRSEKGAWLFYDGEEHRIEAFQTEATDETGAGDMFAGAFVYGLTQGLSPLACGRTACFLASRVVSQLGARLQGNVRKILDHANTGTLS